ncbi:MAG TPA: hypothetical protein PK413_10975, partial [Thermoanaerobaculia bacterium]|nr:hypothetical protein [Thermoanaerobaculia bacterium]
VTDPLPPVRLVRPSDVVIVSGSGRGLVDLANAGLIDGNELVMYSASIPDSSWYTSRLDPSVRFVVTDTNRWDLRDRSLLGGSLSPTMAPGTMLGGPADVVMRKRQGP